MAHIMSKCGSQDNVLTYEHICDSTADLQNINPGYITLGSIAIVLKGLTGLEIYIATSDKQWNLISAGTGSNIPEEEEEIPQINEEDLAGLRRYFIESGADVSLIYTIDDGEPASDNGYADQIVLEDIISAGYSNFFSTENNELFSYWFIKYHDNYYKIKIFDYNNGTSKLYSIEPIWYSSNLTIQEKIEKYSLELLLPGKMIQIGDGTYQPQFVDIPPMVDMSTKLQQIYNKAFSDFSRIYFSYDNQQFYIDASQSQSSPIIENLVFIPSGEGMTDLLVLYRCFQRILPMLSNQ